MARTARRNILMANPFGIGDVLFTTPLIRALRRALPDSAITYVCNARTAEVLETNPHVSGVLVFDSGDLKRLRARSPRRAAGAVWTLLRDVRRLRCDILIDFSLERRYGLAGWLLGIPRRVGFNVKGRGRFLTASRPLRGYEGEHVARHHVSLLTLLGLEATSDDGGLDLVVTESDRGAASRLLSDAGVGDAEPLIVVAPGGGASWGVQASNKQWSPEQFAAAAAALKSRGRIVVIGHHTEQALGRLVAGRVGGAVDLTGRTTVRQAAAVIRRARLLLCNDGGLLHVGASQGTPTVSIFGPVDPAVYGPYAPSGRHEVVSRGLECQPCYRAFRMPPCPYELKCLRSLEPSAVIAAAERALQTG